MFNTYVEGKRHIIHQKKGVNGFQVYGMGATEPGHRLEVARGGGGHQGELELQPRPQRPGATLTENR